MIKRESPIGPGPMLERWAVVALCGFWMTLPFTQYRLLGIGLSEVFGALVILASLLNRKFFLAREAAFLLFMHCLFCAFSIVGIVSSDGMFDAPLRDIFAVSYSLLVAISAANLMCARAHWFRATIIGIGGGIVIHFGALLYSITTGHSAGLWFSESADGDFLSADVGGDAFMPLLPRYIGLSSNPNQLAFYLVFSLFLLNAALWADPKAMKRLWYRGLIVMGIVAALATQSDAAILAMASGLALMAFKKEFPTASPFSILVTYLLLCSSFLIVLVAWQWGIGDDDGGGRLSLWSAALDVIDSAGGIGLGYGAHILDSGVWWESHSTPIDFLLSGGIAGALLLSTIAFVFIRAYLSAERCQPIVTTMTILIFCLTYSAFRHPIFWFVFLLPRVLTIRSASGALYRAQERMRRGDKASGLVGCAGTPNASAGRG